MGLATIAVGALVAVLLIVVRGGNDGAAPVATPDPTTVSTAPDTAMPPATTQASTTSSPTTTAAPTTTVAPTTTLALATVDDLVAALPALADIPVGYMVPTDPPITDPVPETGTYSGFCGSENAPARALGTGAIAIAQGPDVTSDDYRWFDVAIYAFADPVDASAFMARTSAQIVSCATELRYAVGEDRADLFPGDYGPDAVWSVVEVVALLPVGQAPADEAFDIVLDRDFATSHGGYDYSATLQSVDRYERHGRIVVVVRLAGSCCWTGFADPTPERDFVPTPVDLTQLSDTLRPGILQRLAERGLV